jgi:hypothetical protein
MASAEELYKKWKSSPPKEVSVADLRKVAFGLLKPEWVRERDRGSHFLIVEHEILKHFPEFGGHGTLSISSVSGRSVRGHWVKRLVKAINYILEYENFKGEKTDENT